jgi:hypothetical protein
MGRLRPLVLSTSCVRNRRSAPSMPPLPPPPPMSALVAAPLGFACLVRAALFSRRRIRRGFGCGSTPRDAGRYGWRGSCGLGAPAQCVCRHGRICPW